LHVKRNPLGKKFREDYKKNKMEYILHSKERTRTPSDSMIEVSLLESTFSSLQTQALMKGTLDHKNPSHFSSPSSLFLRYSCNVAQQLCVSSFFHFLSIPAFNLDTQEKDRKAVKDIP
jgi:hypothetical protein